jgi:hypothetical protein
MPTPEEKLAYLRGSLEEELDDITAKFPWWKKGLIVAGISVVVLSVGAACGLITLGTAGTAGVPCVVALVALVTLLINLVVENFAARDEADALERKSRQLEALVAEMQPPG